MIKLGAKVRKRTPVMKVEKIYGTKVTCSWIVDGELQGAVFEQDQLEVVPQRPRSVPILRS